MEWEINGLKQNARTELKTAFWPSYGVNVFFSVLTYLVGNLLVGSLFTRLVWLVLDSLSLGYGMFYAWNRILTPTVNTLVTACLTAPFAVGVAHYHCRAPYGERKISNLFEFCRGGRLLPVLRTYGLLQLKLFLWSLLLVVPGIIKRYEYYMVPYLLSENPGMKTRDAFEISRRMTQGEKGRIFLLELSFIGWFLLLLIPYYMGRFSFLLFGYRYFNAFYLLYSLIPALLYSVLHAVLLSYRNSTMAQLYFVYRYNYYEICRREQQPEAVAEAASSGAVEASVPLADVWREGGIAQEGGNEAEKTQTEASLQDPWLGDE